jgi:hypothetical protein
MPRASARRIYSRVTDPGKDKTLQSPPIAHFYEFSQEPKKLKM